MESGLLTLLETLCWNPSSTTSCPWDLGYLVPVSLGFHVCKAGGEYYLLRSLLKSAPWLVEY